jgi:alpha-glucosidase
MTDTAWWQRGIIYQIYPRSFQDSDGDGIGDLAGIRRRLDHLVRIGVDAVWISPYYPSPMADFGYDVADYCDVDPIFGSLADFDALVAEAHARALRVIIDFVPNHTSDRHPWFIASRSSRDDPKRAWYLWHDPAPGGGPPNNWLSNFGGPAWTFDAATGQYYLHSFLAAQPDLNWRNPEVRRAMYDVLRFWLARGVDGFRIDVLYHLIKDDLWRDNPPNPKYRAGAPESHRLLPLYTADRPEVQDIVAEMRKVVAEFDMSDPGADNEHILIGELYLPLERIVAYYGADASGTLRGVQMPFNFLLINAPWTARDVERIVREYEAALPPGGWPNWVLGNHDQSRIATRVGRAQARIAAMLLLTLRGTPTIYQGDELGLVDVPIPPDEIRDPVERNEPGKGLGRDPERTPMPWDTSPNAGFTSGTPWLRLGDDWPAVNVAAEVGDSTSMLALVRTLIALRRAYPALSRGAYETLACDEAVLVFRRSTEHASFVVALNFTNREVPLPALPEDAHHLLLSTRADRVAGGDPPATLLADEGVIFG